MRLSPYADWDEIECHARFITDNPRIVTRSYLKSFHRPNFCFNTSGIFDHHGPR